MILRRIVVALCLTIGVYSWTVVNADEQNDQGAASKAVVPGVIPVLGANEPDKVPYFTKYSVFVSVYHAFRDSLLQQLSANDDAILSVLAAEEQYWLDGENARYMESMRSLCGSRDSLNAVQLATRSEKLADNFNNNRANRYRTAMRALSAGGKQAVAEFIESTIVPGISTGLSNTVNYAKSDPDGFVSSFEITCYVMINGDFPPDVKASMEEDLENLKRETRESPVAIPSTEN